MKNYKFHEIFFGANFFFKGKGTPSFFCDYFFS